MSTQILTELPNIQKAGMDFNSVISEVKDIIANNPNWKENWSSFVDSEAGVLLIQLMAWLIDNMSTRQDLIHNEMFIGTAQKDVNKIRHLKHIGYIPQMPHAAKVPVLITFDKLLNSDVFITPPRNGSLVMRPNDISSFHGKDINGKDTSWEILKITDGKPDYLNSVKLNSGDTEYKEDSQGNTLYAMQGRTKVKQFTALTNDGSSFDIPDANMAADSLQVYITSTGAKLLEVSSFVSKDALDKSLAIPYVLELNEDETYKIRFGNRGILAKERLLPAGTGVTAFYRVCDGSRGNISPEFINAKVKYSDSTGRRFAATIKNETIGFGGTDKETLDQAVLNGPLSLRTMDRAVTPEDYNIILERNTNIFKVKTYTASNQPDGFRNYYGRYINPQESFSFVMFNKNYNGVPTSKYNYFPWMTTNKEPRLNERYVFDNGDYNMPVKISQTSFNVKVMESGGGVRFFKNATVLDLGDEWNQALYDEKGRSNNYLKCKITTKPSDADFFSDIPFSLFKEGNFNYLSIDSESDPNKRAPYFLQMDDHARYFSRQTFDLDTPIDVKEARYLNFTVDGVLDVRVDLWGSDQFLEKDMPEKAYLKWFNEPQGVPSMYAKDSTMNAANYRYGIVQLINDSVVDAIDHGSKFAYLDSTSSQYYGIDYITNEGVDTIKKIALNDEVPLSIKIDGITYLMILSKSYSSSEGFVGQWGSLKNLAAYLTRIFLTGNYNYGAKVKKEVDGEFVDIEKDELKKYKAEAVKRIIFDTDYDYDNDKMEGDSYGSTKLLWDLAIKNRPENKEVLKDITYVDRDKFSHTLHNVVDVEDPVSSVLYDGKEFIGLGNLLRDKQCDRGSGYLPTPTQASQYKDLAGIEIIKDKGKQEIEDVFEEDVSVAPKKSQGKLRIISPTTGQSSSICFKFEDMDKDHGDFGSSYLGIAYGNTGYSNKAYGVKKAYLMRKDALSVTKVNAGLQTDAGISVNKGNIIFENSCIYNNTDFEKLYVSYKIKQNDVLMLGSVYDNFYYTGDYHDEDLKEDVSGISGQFTRYTILDNGVKRYYIDPNKSDFDIRFTNKPQKTNSLYPIKSDLDVVKSERVKITTDELYNFNSEPMAKLVFQIDRELPIEVDLNDCCNGYDVLETIQKEIKSNGSSVLKENFNSVVRGSYQSTNKIIFNSLDPNKGTIKFIYDDSSSLEENKNLYRKLLGNNKSNSLFYKTYNKEAIENKTLIINEVSEEKEEATYFYCPNSEANLSLEFKKLVVGKDGTATSRFADYYIALDEIPMGDQFKYNFFIVRTKNSKFPDKYFYMHFINDKSYNFDSHGNLKENDETLLQNYMYKYKISGTDMTFYQPYFKTYDIAATIKYNANFSETDVVQSVRKAIDSVCDLKYSEIAGSMSRARIFKAIMNCDGVEDCKIRYFGEDYSSGKGNKDTLQADFYEILCLHEDENNAHGKILNFEVNE